jgi:small subunit ribosomal protein S17e
LDRTRRFAEQILSRHPEAFGVDFEKNKKALDDLAIIPSKQLRNRIAGYVTKSLTEDSEEEEAEKGEESPE